MARIPVHWFRWHFAPLAVRTVVVPLENLLADPTAALRSVVDSTIPHGAWVQSIAITGPDGHQFSANVDNFSLLRQFCPELQADAARTGILNAAACAARVHDLSVRTKVRFQPASHFWLIQSVETAVFLAAAMIFIGVAVLCVTRRQPV